MPFENVTQQKEYSINPEFDPSKIVVATPSIKIPVQFSSRSLYSNNYVAAQSHNYPVNHHYTNTFNSGHVGETEIYSNNCTKNVHKNSENNNQFTQQHCVLGSSDLLNPGGAIANFSLSPPCFDGNLYNNQFGSPFSHNFYKPVSVFLKFFDNLNNKFSYSI